MLLACLVCLSLWLFGCKYCLCFNSKVSTCSLFVVLLLKFVDYPDCLFGLQFWFGFEGWCYVLMLLSCLIWVGFT